jgi:hypothetical protein
VAVGWRGPLDYELRVPPGKRMKIVVGLREGYEKLPGKRMLQIEVEGAEPQIVNPVARGNSVPRNIAPVGGNGQAADICEIRRCRNLISRSKASRHTEA